MHHGPSIAAVGAPPDGPIVPHAPNPEEAARLSYNAWNKPDVGNVIKVRSFAAVQHRRPARSAVQAPTNDWMEITSAVGSSPADQNPPCPIDRDPTRTRPFARRKLP